MPYNRILSRIVGTPLAISRAKLDIITSKVAVKLYTGEPIAALAEPSAKARENVPSGAIINVFDALVHHNGVGDSGITSYEGIASQIAMLKQKKANPIGFFFDSPGGEISGLYALSDDIHKLRQEGISTFSIVDGEASSAAYAIAAATDEIYATPTSFIGSIGVVATLVNVSEADSKLGINYTILRSKEKKQALNPHEAFSEDALASLQQKIDKLDTIFNAKVNTYRPALSLESIVNMEADVFLAQDALSLGLIDGIVDIPQEFINKKLQSNHKVNVMTPEEIAALQAENARLKAEAQNGGSTAVKAEQQRILEILAAGEKFKISAATVQKRIASSMSSADVVSLFEEMAAEKQAATPLPIATAEGLGTLLDKKEKEEPAMSAIDTIIKGIQEHTKTMTGVIR